MKSEVEETIERIRQQVGVEGYVICNKQGQVLRRFPTMTQDDAEKYARSMISLGKVKPGIFFYFFLTRLIPTRSVQFLYSYSG